MRQLTCCRVGAREEQLDRRVQALGHADHNRRAEHPEDVVEEEPAQQKPPCIRREHTVSRCNGFCVRDVNIRSHIRKESVCAKAVTSAGPGVL